MKGRREPQLWRGIADPENMWWTCCIPPLGQMGSLKQSHKSPGSGFLYARRDVFISGGVEEKIPFLRGTGVFTVKLTPGAAGKVGVLTSAGSGWR